MSEKGSISVSPPGITQYFNSDGRCSAVGVKPGITSNVAGPFDFILSVPAHLLLCDRPAAMVELSAAVRYNRDDPANTLQPLPGVEAGLQMGLESGDRFPFHGGLNAQVDWIRLGPLRIGSGAMINLPFNTVFNPLLLTLDFTGSNGDDSFEAANTAAPQGGRSTVASVNIQKRSEEPLSVGLTLSDGLKGSIQIQEAISKLLGVETADLTKQLAATNGTLKPDDTLITQSPLAKIIKGGGESIIGILRVCTPDRDHVLDEHDGEIFFGKLTHIALDLHQRLDRLSGGEVINDMQNVSKPDGSKEPLPLVHTGMLFPKTLYPNMNVDFGSGLIAKHGQYYHWAPGYKMTSATAEDYLYFYLVNALNVHGITWNEPIKKYADIRSTAWMSAIPLMNNYKAHLNRNFESLKRASSGENLKQTELVQTYGGWLFVELENGDTYVALHSYAKPGQKDWMLSLAKSDIAEETQSSYVKFAHGMGERSKNPQWVKPEHRIGENSKDESPEDVWKREMTFFKLGVGVDFPDFRLK